tara:strand:- start:346 stop:513 length:168 start_codon:yes stop_codon:yes gene_type:complete
MADNERDDVLFKALHPLLAIDINSQVFPDAICGFIEKAQLNTPETVNNFHLLLYG